MDQRAFPPNKVEFVKGLVSDTAKPPAFGVYCVSPELTQELCAKTGSKWYVVTVLFIAKPEDQAGGCNNWVYKGTIDVPEKHSA